MIRATAYLKILQNDSVAVVEFIKKLEETNNPKFESICKELRIMAKIPIEFVEEKKLPGLKLKSSVEYEEIGCEFVLYYFYSNPYRTILLRVMASIETSNFQRRTPISLVIAVDRRF